MKLKQLLENVDVVSPIPDVEINDICTDCSQFTENSLFFITDAGCSKIVSFTNNILQAALSTHIGFILWDVENWPKHDHDIESCRYIDVKYYRRACAQICANFYEHPSKNLLMIGITGTNGKTSTNYLIERILLFSKLYQPLLIGTLNTRCGDVEIQPSYTTPYCDIIQKLLRNAIDKYHADSAIMELSSRGLDQDRVRGIEFDVVIYTNITHDHLDYHETFEEYKRAKTILFEDLAKSFAIINRDDDHAQHFIDKTKKNVKLMTYGIARNLDTDIYANNIQSSIHGLNFDIHISATNTTEHICIPHLIGKTNVYNALAALACAHFALNVPLDLCKQALVTIPPIPGRLELLTAPDDPITVIIDSAHTSNGFEEILSTIRECMTSKTLICLFGCRGNVDRLNRPLKANIVRKICDKIIVTTDSSTSEDPQQIIQDILVGFPSGSNDIIIEIDRKQAIEKAILSIMQDGDTLVILGKRQDINFMLENCMITFDDRTLVRDCIQKRFQSNSK